MISSLHVVALCRLVASNILSQIDAQDDEAGKEMETGTSGGEQKETM